VKALGYEGGVKIAFGRQLNPENGQYGSFQLGDILVGLHVWPTTSLQQVTEVLARDDLAELNPIKFYVVRPTAPRDPFGGGDSPHASDELISGRIQVRPHKEPSMRVPWNADPRTDLSNPSRSAAANPQEMMRMLRAAEPETTTQVRATRTLKADSPANQESKSTVEPVVAPDAGAPSRSPSPSDSASQRELPQVRTSSEVAATAPSSIQPAPTDRTVVVYSVPDDLRDDVQQNDSATDLQGIWDERGRFVAQGTQEQHEQFTSLLEATPKWREARGTRQREMRRRGGIVVRQKDNSEVLEWPTAGLTFARETRPEFSGVVVVEVAPGSPAAWQGVQPGEIMTRVENFSTRSLAELASVIQALLSSFPNEGKQLDVLFLRNTDRGVRSLRRELPLRLESTEETESGPRDVRSTRPTERRRATTQASPPQAERRTSTTSKTPATRTFSADTPAEDVTKAAAELLAEAGVDPKAGSVQLEFVPHNGGSALVLRGRAVGNRSAATNKANLRYEGKTFDEWRNAWRTELSTEKRREAVKALAAFGASGYGREAAEAIFEIARQYDWSPESRSERGGIQAAILNALFGGETLRGIPAREWFPMIIEQVDAGDHTMQQFAESVVENLHRLDGDIDFAKDSLLELSRSQSSPLRRGAMRALVAGDRETTDPRIVARLQEMLESDDVEQMKDALACLLSLSVPLPFDASGLLFHPDEGVRRAARYAIHHLNPPQGQNMVQFLTSVLEDPNRADDHLAAIRALRPLEERATSAYVTLEKLAMNREQPMAIRIAAAVAAQQIMNDGGTKNRLQQDFMDANRDRHETPEFRMESKQFGRAIQEEQEWR
jgi:hypothetical protein